MRVFHLSIPLVCAATMACGSTSIPRVDRALRGAGKAAVVAAAGRIPTAERDVLRTFAARNRADFLVPDQATRNMRLKTFAAEIRRQIDPGVTAFALSSDATVFESAGPLEVPAETNVLERMQPVRRVLMDGVEVTDLLEFATPTGGSSTVRLTSAPIMNHGAVIGAWVVLAPLESFASRLETAVRASSPLLNDAEVCIGFGDMPYCPETAEEPLALLDAARIGSTLRVDRLGSSSAPALLAQFPLDTSPPMVALVWASAK